jgi:DNA polymerase sliding clamp subunit (PCNA homolog)
VDAVSALIEEANFALASDGLKLRALDPSRTAMIDLLIPKEAFEEFPESLNEEVRIGVNFDDFKKLLRRIKKGDKLGIEVGEGKLKVRLLGKASRTMTLPLVDIGAEELPTPKVV